MYQKLGDTSSLREESQPILTESALSEPRAMDSVIDALETVSAKLMKNYDSGNYTEVIRIAQGVLAQDTQNTEALEYLSKARTRINANRIAEYVSIGKRDYENGDYERCKDNMVLALNIDSQNAEAQRFYALADKALSEVAIGEIVERQRRAEEQKDLLTFLSDIGPEELQEKKRTDVVALFNSYDDINSRISDLSIEFIDLDHADVAFSHLLVGVDKASGKKKVIFEGRKTLTLERSGEAWKILVYR